MLEPMFFTKTEELTKDYGRFVFEPLADSFGESVGNALRRTLLSSLPGAAVGFVKVEGAPHLFTTIKGVKESVLDVVLNLRQLKFVVPGDESYKIYLSAKGAGKIYAKDIEGEAKVVNGDMYIAEITDPKGKLEIEAIVEKGYGFVSAEEKERKETGFITVDSSFSPVKKVNFKVEDTRVGRTSNYDKLTLEVWTDGTISPKDAIAESCKILEKHFSHVFSGRDTAEEKTDEVATEEKAGEEASSQLNDIIIDELNLPSRVINALLRENIETVADLIKRGRENLVGLKGVGRKSLDLIDEELKKMNIELK